MSSQAADIVCEELKRKPDMLLCLSAGGTPTGLYEELVKRRIRNPKPFRQFLTMGVDEWGGLPAGSAGTCKADLEKKLLDPIKLKPNRCHFFSSNSPNPERECGHMARWLAANGPIDICILGLGLNGHVAMNEPTRALNPHIHVATLAQSSSRHPMLKSAQHRPRYGLTLGLREILSSRKILLLVSGEAKRPILKRLLQSPVTTNLPASFLWLHSNTTVLCDQAALGQNVTNL